MTEKTTSLIVTVDTEEEGLWSGSYRVKSNKVTNISGTRRFQSLCSEYSIRPTYLVDYPVVDDDAASAILQEHVETGRAEIGAHLHPWCSPPYSEDVSTFHSYMCNLPEKTQREKLVVLTEAIRSRFGKGPTSFRAGRYGMDANGIRILSELGFKVDSSVVPFTSFQADGGPDFRDAPTDPYVVKDGDICKPDRHGRVLEVPVTCGFNRANFYLANRVRSCAERLPRCVHAVGILDRLGIVKKIRFSPEQADARALKSLVDVCQARGCPSMVMLMHSTSFVSGFSPYCATNHDLERFYETLRDVFHHCVVERGMPTHSLTGFYHHFTEGLSRGSA